MKFYKVKSPLAFHRTQADVGKQPFEAIDVDTSHKGLTAFFASLIAEVAGSHRQPSAPAQDTEVQHAPPATEVPAPEKKPKSSAVSINPVVVEIMNATVAEEFIWKAEEDRLAKLEATIHERRKELALQSKAERSTIVPPVRTRKRPA